MLLLRFDGERDYLVVAQKSGNQKHFDGFNQLKPLLIRRNIEIHMIVDSWLLNIICLFVF